MDSTENMSSKETSPPHFLGAFYEGPIDSRRYEAFCELGEEDTRVNENQGIALSTLERFPSGATRGDWWKLTGLAESTFDRARDFLVEGGYVLHDEDTKLYATTKNYAEPPIAA